MRLRLYHVDAFTDFALDNRRKAKSGTRPPASAGGRVTDRLFSGNPAGVVVLDARLPDRLMQAVAAENNMSETAFVVPEDAGFGIRWFTPLTEVALCGHATLASAHVLFNHLGHPSDMVSFRSRKSGVLLASREGDRIVLDFPADKLRKAPAPAGLSRALGRRPVGTWRGKTDLLCLFRSQKDIEGLRPDLAALASIRARGVIATAPGRSVDFVSRFFGPAVGVPEDPVTGSAHTTLAVFWAPRLGKTVMEAAQLSKRGGRLRCTLDSRRVKIAGMARTHLVGDIDLFQEDLA